MGKKLTNVKSYVTLKISMLQTRKIHDFNLSCLTIFQTDEYPVIVRKKLYKEMRNVT